MTGTRAWRGSARCPATRSTGRSTTAVAATWGRSTPTASGTPAASVVPPIGERLLLRWNADPYQLAAGSGGRTRGDGAFILLPYWMGKYHRLLESR